MWEEELKGAHAQKSIAFTRYSYVSLFGLNSLDDVRLAIFQNVITFADGLKRADLATLDAFVSNHVNLRKWSTVAAKLPIISRFVGPDLTNIVAGLAVREQIICVDDFERRGKNLSVSDVLGLLSDLKEIRDCKIMLILNDEQLDAEKESFDRNIEKIVDVSMLYAPSSTEAAAIAIPEKDAISEKIRERCISLGITNIRVIRRIAAKVRSVAQILAPYDEAVLETVLPSVVLFSWAHDQPDDAPSLKFLEEMTPGRSFGGARDNASAEEVAWTSLLEAFGYRWTDELDLLLLNAVKHGHFDAELLEPAFKEASDKATADKIGGSFEAAWGGFHDSFADDADEVLDTLYAAFKRSARYITPLNLNGTIRLFKEVGRDDQAQELLAYYMSERGDTPALFDLSDHPFAGDVTDPDIRAAFAKKFEETQQAEIVDVAKLLIATRRTLDVEQIASLSMASMPEYVSAFKGHSGDELHDMLASAFQSDRIVNASPEMKKVAALAREALAIIGAESAINARRVKRFGVEIPPPATNATAASADE